MASSRLGLPGIVLATFALLLVGALAAAPADAAKLRLSDLEISTTPELYPAFDPSISRYVARCADEPIEISVTARHGTKARIDDGDRRSGTIRANLALDPGAATVIHARNDSAHGRYEIRCLPADFPQYTFERFGGPTPKWELTSVGDYAVIFDRNGVPAWWLAQPRGINDAKVLPNGNLAWWSNGTVGPYGTDPDAVYLELGLGGHVKHRVRAVDVSTDLHDMQQLPNGDYLVLAYDFRSGVDLTEYGFEADATVLDPVIQQVDHDGDLVWSWQGEDHIGLDETGRWWPGLHGPFYDILHINSVDVAGDSLIVSFRHADAVYSIDRSSGDINWKLGGTETPDSLEVRNDPLGDYPLGGQHDARMNKHGHLTVFDDQTDPACGQLPPAPKCELPPRAVEYEVDEKAGTAKLVDSLADPKVDSTWCCGGARQTRDGNWMVTWGAAPLATGFASDGSITQRYDFTATGQAIYRVLPLSRKDFTSARLRNAMNRMYPR